MTLLNTKLTFIKLKNGLERMEEVGRIRRLGYIGERFHVSYFVYEACAQ